MIEALKLALVIEEFDKNDESIPLELLKPIAATLRAIAELESQEPVACIVKGCENYKNQGRFVGNLCSSCYGFLTTGDGKYSQAYCNTQRQWVGLTDGVMCDIAIKHGLMNIDWIDFARDIETKLRSKNEH